MNFLDQIPDVDIDIYNQTMKDIYSTFLKKYNSNLILKDVNIPQSNYQQNRKNHNISDTTRLNRRDRHNYKYHNDPEFNEKHKERSKTNNYNKYHNDPEFREKKLLQSKLRYQQKKLEKLSVL